MAKTILNSNYLAIGAIGACLIVKHGANDGEAVQSAAATDALMGVNETIDTADGERCDVKKSGIADVFYGGNVAKGDPLTSDANGRAIKATPAAGSNVRLIGFAEVAGVVGDIGSVLIQLSVMQG